MKVLYFHQHFSTPQGATGIRSYEMAQRLINCGHEVTMVCGRYSGGVTGLWGPFKKGSRAGTVKGIKVIEFDLAYSNSDSFFKRSVIFVTFAFRSILLALTEQYDVIFATTTPLTAGIPGIFARWLRGKRFVFEVRDLWPELPREMGVIKNKVVLAAMAFLEWASYRSAHRLVGLSPGIVEGIARLGVAKTNIIMLPNGCDLGLFSQKIEPWRPASVRKTDLLAVYAGTHGIANGLDAVLNVALELKKRNRDDIRILFVGQGKLKRELQDRAEEMGLDNVIFNDPINKIRLIGLLKATDVGMQILANVPAFYYGTSPNKFFDYISAGIPVLNNYPGWLSEMITENRCGFVVPPADPKAFASALEYAADHRDELKEMGAQSLKLAKNRFDRKILANHFVGWLEDAFK